MTTTNPSSNLLSCLFQKYFLTVITPQDILALALALVAAAAAAAAVAATLLFGGMTIAL